MYEVYGGKYGWLKYFVFKNRIYVMVKFKVM